MFGLVMIGLGSFILYLVVWPTGEDSQHTRLEMFIAELGYPLEGLREPPAWASGGQNWGNSGGGGDGSSSGFDNGPGLPDLTPVPPTSDTGTRNGDVVGKALQALGTPYLFGGTNPFKGIDCSALTQWAFGQFGKALPRTAQQQYNVASPTDEPKRGDLVFFTGTYPTGDFISHVGIYMGDGKMVSARDGGVGTDSITSGYWKNHFVGFGRV